MQKKALLSTHGTAWKSREQRDHAIQSLKSHSDPNFPPTDAAIARQAFRHDLATTYQIIEVTPALANRAMLFAEQYGLRGYDAIQLAAGIEVHGRYVAAGLPAVTCISADTEINAAAIAEGLTIADPNRYP